MTTLDIGASASAGLAVTLTLIETLVRKGVLSEQEGIGLIQKSVQNFAPNMQPGVKASIKAFMTDIPL